MRMRKMLPRGSLFHAHCDKMSSEEAPETPHIQASFSTKNVKYSIPKTSFSIPVTANRDDLSSLINQLLQDQDSSNEGKSTYEFDFFINNELIRGTLESHISERGILIENVIEIEYSDRNPPPSLSDVFDHKDWVSCVHCNKKFVLSGSYDNTVRIWNLDGAIQSEGIGHTGPIKDVKWITPVDDASVDEQGLLFLSASQDQNIHLWQFSKPSESKDDSGDDNIGDGNNAADSAVLLHQFKGHARSVDALAVSPNKQEFCSVSWDTYLKIWSAVPDSSPLDEVEDESNLTSKKRKVSTTSRSSHQATTRTPLVTLQGHTQPATGIVWVEQGEIVSAGWDMCIRVWDVTTGSNTPTLSGPKAFHDIDKSQLNHLIASANSDKYVRIWDQRSSENSMMKSTLSSHQGWVVSVCWSPSDPHQLLSASYDSTLRLWDIRSTKQPLYTITAHEGKVLCCDWTIPNLFVSGGEDNKLRTFLCNN